MATKYRIEYIATFHTDVLAVVDFLAEYPAKAARIFQEIDRILSRLSTMPEKHPVYRDMPAFRVIIVEDYLVFYKIKKTIGVIEIHRLLHGHMNIHSILTKN